MRAPAPKRIAQDAAFVLHHYDWSESSLILEVFSRQSGRITLVAKGAKKPTSNFRAVLLPLQRLELGYSLPAEGEIGTLKAAHWASSYTLPMGDALLAGYYCNELLLKLLPRQDAQPALFEHYASCVALLALLGKQHTPLPQALPAPIDTASILRAFELLLLRDLGLLPALNTSASGHPLQAEDACPYQLLAEQGLCLAPPDAPPTESLSADTWLRLHAALHTAQAQGLATALPALLALTPVQRNSLRVTLRHVLHHHIGAPLKTRQLMAALQGL